MIVLIIFISIIFQKLVYTQDIITTIAGTGTTDSGDGGPATSATLQVPTAVCSDASGIL